MKPIRFLRVALAVLAFAVAGTAASADPQTFTIVAKDGGFEPATLEVPAGQRFKLEVRNESAAAIEFESKDLKQEKVIRAKGSATLSIAPLKAGTYRFVDEYKEATAKGQIVAK